MNGTTIKTIAAQGGISESVIYRHFESKDQLFYEAVVEPLREAVDKLVAAAEVVDRDEPLTPERQVETLNGLYRQLVATLEEVLPLLGLVLFGDPEVARRFYTESFAVAMDRLAEAWRQVEGRYGYTLESPDISARAVMGIALDHRPRIPPQPALQPRPRPAAHQRRHVARLLPDDRARPPRAVSALSSLSALKRGSSLVPRRHLVAKNRRQRDQIPKERPIARRFAIQCAEAGAYAACAALTSLDGEADAVDVGLQRVEVEAVDLGRVAVEDLRAVVVGHTRVA